MLLFGQMQKGLRYALIESLSVSGATNYQSLCMATKSVQKRQAVQMRQKRYKGDFTSNSLSLNPNEPGVMSNTKPRDGRLSWKCKELGIW